MQITTVGNYPITLGWILAIIILILAIIGLVGVLPFTGQVIFGLIGGLALARLI